MTAVGYQALYLNTTGSDNVAVGNTALKDNTTGYENVAVGVQALWKNTTADRNTAIGNNCLRLNETADDNTAVGWYALRPTTGAANSALGAGAGSGNTSGYNNTYIGVNAGSNLTGGAQNLFVGYASQASGVNVSNENVFGNNLTGKGANTSYIYGSAYQGNNSADWSTTSDRRLKKNIVNNNIGLEKITAIQVRNFEYRVEDEIKELPTHAAIKKEGVQLGVIAQELQAILPECVKTESTGVMSVDSDNLKWYMINAIKELKAEFDAYKATHP
jgi:hypothetical protein